MTIVVTRHKALVELLRERRVIDEPCKECGKQSGFEDEHSSCSLIHEPVTRVVTHATPDDVKDIHVVGVLPLHLACLASRVTEIPLSIPPELRGVELDIDQLRQFAGDPVTYCVRKTNSTADDLILVSRKYMDETEDRAFKGGM